MPRLNEQKLLRLIKYAPTAIIGTFVIALNLIILQNHQTNTKREIQTLQQGILQNQKQEVYKHVDHVINQIIYEKNLLEERLKQEAKQRVNEAYSIAMSLYTNNQHLAQHQVTRLIVDALRPIRFYNGRGYFFIFTMDGVNIMHGLKPDLEGKSQWNSQDIHGTYILREHIQLIKQQGDAFYRWWYSKPGQPVEKEFEKIGYGKQFEPYNWFIGTGEYLVDVESDVKEHLLTWAGNYQYGDGSFISVIDKKGRVIVSQRGALMGKNIDDIFTHNELSISSILEQTNQGGGFITYHSDSECNTEVTSYFKAVAGWDWIISSSFCLDSLQATLYRQEAEVRDHNQLALIKILALSVVSTLVTIYLSLLLSNITASRFKRFKDQILDDYSELEQTKNRIQHMAMHDDLTGLPNRSALLEKLNNCIEVSRESNKQLALIFIDLDNFKKINDLYGHSSGDKLLEAISKKFQAQLDKDDFLARFGGDEFVFCFPLLNDVVHARQKTMQIKSVFKDPLVIGGKLLETNCTMGVTMYPTDGETAEALIRKTDIVLHKAKAQRRGDIIFYDNSINEQVKYNYVLEEELTQAINKEELSVLYQPQIDVRTNKMVSVEALARWRNPTLGMVPPDKFIRTAEEIGLINQIGLFVFQKACEQILTVSGNGPDAVKLAVNISPYQLMEPNFTSQLTSITTNIGLDVTRVTLEITENIFIYDLNKVSNILSRLRDIGFGISLDDFGTGYSSLSYLNSLPITEIKIDRCFIDKLLTNEQSDSLVKTIIAIGNSCEVEVVAEGVETDAQYQKLLSYQCDMVQGYYFDKPLTIEQLINRYDIDALA